jgi:DNA processing protein
LARNKLIAAMSKVVIIGEGKRRSGTLSTANHAADLGIEVMVLPFEPGEYLSGAAEYLVENGARVVESMEEILEFM